MPIWSFTQERLDKLKEQIAKKKGEHDELEAKSEKDLWVADLEEFEAEWENQLRIDAEITTSIRRMGRRVSKKIGAGRGRKPKDDDDYAEPKPKKAAAKKVTKPKVIEQKSHLGFAAKFDGKKKTDGADDESDAFSDDDFAALKSKPTKRAATKSVPLDPPSDLDEEDDIVVPKSKPTKRAAAKAAPPDPPSDVDDEVEEESVAEEVAAPAAGRGKRAAAAKTKSWIIDDEDFESSGDDDDNMLGDVGALVKGIPGNSGDAGEKTGRLSLFAMSGAGSSLKTKAKPNKTLDVDSHDDTNYEMLARASPHKSPFTRDEVDVDSFLSDDDLPAAKPPVKATTVSRPKPSTSPVEEPKAAPAVKKARGRPAGAKNKDAPAPKKKAAAAKPTQLSPAAKLYAKKKGTEKAKSKKDDFDMDDDEDEEMAEPASPPPKPAARGRPGRAAAASKKKYVVESDDDDDDMELDDDEGGGQSDDFAMDDSD
jgi:DNA topoisomerase II